MHNDNVDFEIIHGDNSVFEIWKYSNGQKWGMLGMINDLDRAIEIVDKLYAAHGNDPRI